MLVTFTCMTIFTPALGHFETHQSLTLLLSFSIKRSHLNIYTFLTNIQLNGNHFAKLNAHTQCQSVFYGEPKGTLILQVPNKQAYSIRILIFFSPPYLLDQQISYPTIGHFFWNSTNNKPTYLTFSYFPPPYLFIWAYSFMKFAKNIHPTCLFRPTFLIGT